MAPDFRLAGDLAVSVKGLEGQGAHYAEAFVSRAKADANLDPSIAAQLQQDLMLEFHKVSDDARRKEDELLQRNVSAAAHLRSREV